MLSTPDLNIHGIDSTKSKKFMTKLNSGIFILLIISTVIPASVAGADENRDKIIDRQLSCWDKSNGHSAQWKDICSTDTPVPQGRERERLIEKELNAVSYRINNSQEQVEPSVEAPDVQNEMTISPINEKQFIDEHFLADEEVAPAKVSKPRNLRNENPGPVNVREEAKKSELAYQLDFYRYQAEGYWPYYYSYVFPQSYKVEKGGILNGLYLSYTYRKPYNRPVHTWRDLKSREGGPGYPFTFYRFEADISGGKTYFKTDALGTEKNIGAWGLNLRLLGGYDFLSQDNTFMFTPYIGVGYKRFVDRSGGWIDYYVGDYVPYEVIYNYVYVPVGFETIKTINKDIDFSFRAEASLLLTGSVGYMMSADTTLYHWNDPDDGSDVYGHVKDTDVEMKGGFGLSGSCKVIRKFDRYNIFAQPFVDFWYFKKSKAEVTTFIDTDGGPWYSANFDLSKRKDNFEPVHYTLHTGLRLGVQF